jgi:DNA-binding transcriptional LysR family regulator
LEVELLFHERISVVAGARNRWVRRRRIDLAELMGEPWALPPPHSLPGRLVADAFRASGLDMPHATVYTASIHLLSNSLPATGRFLTVLPSSFLRFNAERLSLKALPVELLIEPGPVGIVRLKGRMLSPIAQLFIEYAQEAARPMMGAG